MQKSAIAKEPKYTETEKANLKAMNKLIEERSEREIAERYDKEFNSSPVHFKN